MFRFPSRVGCWFVQLKVRLSIPQFSASRCDSRLCDKRLTGGRGRTDLYVSSVSGADVPPPVELRERPEGGGDHVGAHPPHGVAEHVVHVPQEEGGEVTGWRDESKRVNGGGRRG